MSIKSALTANNLFLKTIFEQSTIRQHLLVILLDTQHLFSYTFFIEKASSYKI